MQLEEAEGSERGLQQMQPVEASEACLRQSGTRPPSKGLTLSGSSARWSRGEAAAASWSRNGYLRILAWLLDNTNTAFSGSPCFSFFGVL